MIHDATKSNNAEYKDLLNTVNSQIKDILFADISFFLSASRALKIEMLTIIYFSCHTTFVNPHQSMTWLMFLF